jgi:peptide/nickel transport system permease protein
MQAAEGRLSRLGLMLRQAGFRHSVNNWLGVALLLLMLVMAVAGVLMPDSANAPDYGAIQQPPSLAHPFGTDALGRDVMLRVIDGAPTSLLVGLVVALVSAVLGIAGGAAAGYFGKWVDVVISRTTDYFLTIPPFFFVLVAVSILGASTLNSSLIIGIALSASTARQVRAQFLTLREREFVASARLIGMSTPAIIFTEILPNAVQPAIVQSALNAAAAVLIHAGLGFLGLSDPNEAEWGAMISENFARGLFGWWSIIAPGIAVTFLVVGLTILGDQLNRYFDVARRY